MTHMAWKIQGIKFEGQPPEKRGQLGSRLVLEKVGWIRQLKTERDVTPFCRRAVDMRGSGNNQLPKGTLSGVQWL